ncbi:MAG: hypothetical protein NTV52_27515 [Acidobacteria bacterium]|nr:hypothetical protein [Acidobacteriota bacterium]
MERRSFLALPWFGRRKEIKACGARFRVIRRGSTARRYLFIHGDETTARDALAAHLTAHDGIGYSVLNGKRTITGAHGMVYDPNRMFSEEGLRRNLDRLNPKAEDWQKRAVLEIVAQDRESFVRRLTPPGKGLLVALHNNARGYSVKDEVAISEEVSLQDEAHLHEFLLCTDPGDFAKLKTSPFNVVLQGKPGGEEDGSLSRLMAKRGIRYVNIEAGIGKAAEQKAMLDWVQSNL